MRTYAQIKDGEVQNLAVFTRQPPQGFAGFDAHVLVPEGLPVAIGGTWDGTHFYDGDGEIVVHVEVDAGADPGYDEFADMQEALGILMGEEGDAE